MYGDPVVSDVNTVVTTGETVLYSGAKDPQVDYDKLLGENGLTDKDAKYFWNYNSGKYIPNTTEKYGDKTANVKGATLTIIDNNGDGEVDYVLSVEKALADITSVNSKKETVTVRTLGTLDNKDVVGYEDMAKEDVGPVRPVRRPHLPGEARGCHWRDGALQREGHREVHDRRRREVQGR